MPNCCPPRAISIFFVRLPLASPSRGLTSTENCSSLSLMEAVRRWHLHSCTNDVESPAAFSKLARKCDCKKAPAAALKARPTVTYTQVIGVLACDKSHSLAWANPTRHIPELTVRRAQTLNVSVLAGTYNTSDAKRVN